MARLSGYRRKKSSCRKYKGGGISGGEKNDREI
jgi:hypothetical protein